MLAERRPGSDVVDFERTPRRALVPGGGVDPEPEIRSESLANRRGVRAQESLSEGVDGRERLVRNVVHNTANGETIINGVPDLRAGAGEARVGVDGSVSERADRR